MFDLLALRFPGLDPVALEIGPIVIRWYALAYITGILGGWWLIGWIDRTVRPEPLLSKKQRDDMIVWGVFGVILGGRIGYVLFYNLPYFLENPGDALKLWQGGMSFHGGALGVILGFYIFARLQKISYLKLMDMICCAVPIGLFFGRIANFINGELYGRITDVSWGVIFPRGGPYPRHPSQLYEAALEGLILFTLLLWMMRATPAKRYPGVIAGMFLTGYGLSRFVVEFVREPDAHIGYLSLGLTMGQYLSLPMIIGGMAIMAICYQRAKHSL